MTDPASDPALDRVPAKGAGVRFINKSEAKDLAELLTTKTSVHYGAKLVRAGIGRALVRATQVAGPDTMLATPVGMLNDAWNRCVAAQRLGTVQWSAARFAGGVQSGGPASYALFQHDARIALPPPSPMPVVQY